MRPIKPTKRQRKIHNDYYKSKRRHDIAKSWGWEAERGRFVKGKIHCSCPICAEKTNKLLLPSTYNRKGKNWPVSDLRKSQFYTEE